MENAQIVDRLTDAQKAEIERLEEDDRYRIDSAIKRRPDYQESR